MKKMFVSIIILIAVTVLFFAIGTTASAETFGDLYYSVADGEVSITGCDTSVTEVEIPSEIDSYPVTSINDAAFYNCNSLTSVNIPDTVKIISDGAFENCSSLEKIVMPDSVTSIGGGVFSGCAALENVFISENITRISGAAFAKCTSLKEIKIPESVVNIGSDAFNGCFALEIIIIPAGLTTVEYRAFKDCVSLEKIVLGKNVDSVGNSAFSGCSGLSEIIVLNSECVINDSPETIYSGTKVYGYSGSTAEAYALKYGREFVSFESQTAFLTYEITDGEVTITDCDESVSGYVVIPEMIDGYPVTCIGSGAFNHCNKITGVTISDNITTIGGWAFYGCDSLTDITIPDSVITIDRFAFFDCNSMEFVVLGENVKTIGYSAFATGENLEYVYWNAKNVTNADYSFCVGVTIHRDPDSPYDTVVECGDGFYVIYGNNVETIPSSAFHEWFAGSGGYETIVKLKGITIGKNVKKINDYAFYGCFGFTTITIPDSVTMIGDYAFSSSDYKSSDLEIIIIPDSVTTIGRGAFTSCRNLKKAVISKSVSALEEKVFSYCSALTDVSIPFNVNEIMYGAFENCENLTNVYYGGSVTSWNNISVGSYNTALHNVNLYTDICNGTELHNYSYITVSPTCYNRGYTTYTCECGYSYTGSYVDPTGHSYTRNVTAPTCVDMGYTTYTCHCGNSYVSNHVSATGIHTEEVVPGTAATCTEEGLTTSKKCSVCDLVLAYPSVTPATGHTEVKLEGKSATCTESGLTEGKKCSVCNEILVEQTVIPATGHTPGEWVVVSEAQVGVEGKEQQKCTVCDDVVDERSIPALPEVTYVVGDANGDGKITAADARIALRISAKVDNIENYNLPIEAFDVTSDGKLTAADARKILRIAAKIETI